MILPPERYSLYPSGLVLKIMEGAAAEEEWSIGPSDDELASDSMDPSSKYFTPKDPEEIERLARV